MPNEEMLLLISSLSGDVGAYSLSLHFYALRLALPWRVMYLGCWLVIPSLIYYK